ncbi:hypothetical protein GDO81_028511 [Engystomops pustulosus]|uniref:Uncharacterized protein n=1 Tax=Engystomops pustulosus TaxID=76066 RepID=A0AAV6YN52_ENGPU|nr:hypothetical protein GDO81_028511 [Engystomops pustulosus]
MQPQGPVQNQRMGTLEKVWRTHSLSWEVEIYSALSCVFSVSWGVCTTYHSLSLYSCRVCRWCGHVSASFCHCCWQNVCHSLQIHI